MNKKTHQFKIIIIIEKKNDFEKWTNRLSLLEDSPKLGGTELPKLDKYRKFLIQNSIKHEILEGRANNLR